MDGRGATGHEQDTSLAWAGWTLTAYALTQTVAMPVIGKLAEQFGQMRVFVICVCVFILGSLLCGLAPGIGWLIAFRALQGLGAVFVSALGAAIIGEMFPPQERGRAMGTLVGCHAPEEGEVVAATPDAEAARIDPVMDDSGDVQVTRGRSLMVRDRDQRDA